MHIQSPIKQSGSSAQNVNAEPMEGGCLQYTDEEEVGTFSFSEISGLFLDQAELFLKIKIKELTVKPVAFFPIKEKLHGINFCAQTIFLQNMAFSELERGHVFLEAEILDIEDAAFMRAQGVEKIALKGAMQNKNQYQTLFQGCEALKCIDLLNVTGLDLSVDALKGCDQLKEILYPQAWTEKKKAAFVAFLENNQLGKADSKSENVQNSVQQYELGSKKAIKPEGESKKQKEICCGNNGINNMGFSKIYEQAKQSEVGLMGLSLYFILTSAGAYALSQLMLIYFSFKWTMVVVALSVGTMSAFIVKRDQNHLLSKVNQICVHSESLFHQDPSKEKDLGNVNHPEYKKELGLNKRG